mgnify:CR=1 FL=1
MLEMKAQVCTLGEMQHDSEIMIFFSFNYNIIFECDILIFFSLKKIRNFATKSMYVHK